MNKEKLNQFFDFVSEENFSIEELIEATELWITDYREDVLEDVEAQKKATIAISFLKSARKMIKETEE